MIDPHVHFRDWEQTEKETLCHGMRSGLGAGVTTFFDMPNTVPPLTDEATILRRLALAGNVIAEIGGANIPRISYHVYGGITTDTAQVRAMADLHARLFPAMVGLKFFAGHSTGHMGVIEEEKQKSVYRTLADCGYSGVVALHCEKEALLKPELDGMDEGRAHSLSRPPQAEVESVRDQICFAREAGFAGTLHICHISTVGALALVEEARAEGMKITCGVTPHHALLSVEDALPQRHLSMNPPLRSPEERDGMFAALLDGRIDWIETDHAPHSLEDKKNGANGIPGFTGTMLLIRHLRNAGCTEERLVDLLGRNVQKAFGLSGQKIIVPDSTFIDSRLDRSRVRYPWDPYEGVE